jgi:5-methylcytosine-specific restriction endonuclease McrA
MPVEFECDFCGKSITKSPSEVEGAEHHFCDRECYGNWHSKGEDSRLVLECDYCGTEYRRYEASQGTVADRKSPSDLMYVLWGEHQTDPVRYRISGPAFL